MELSEGERQYLEGQRLGRLATIGPDGGPQARPVVFSVNDELGTIDIAGKEMTSSQKYRNVERSPLVSFVVDDLESVKPWKARGIEIRGRAEALADVGEGLIRIHPTRILAWGIDTAGFGPPNARDV